MTALHSGPRTARRTPPGFDDRAYTRFSVTPLEPTIGAEIDGVELGAAFDDELHAELRRALLEWKVLFSRDQDITLEQHRDFDARWGVSEEHPLFKIVYDGRPHRTS